MTNEKAPERIIVCTDGHKPAIADWAKDRMKDCDVEYVRADLLVTKVKEEREAALRDAIKIARAELTSEDSDSNIGVNNVIIALERALTEK